MIKKVVPLMLFIFLLLLNSCSKEDWPRVEYEVLSRSSVDISYTMTSGNLNFETIAGSWSKSFRHRQGATIFLSARHIGGIGNTTISVYVNKELLWRESTSIPGEVIQISEVLP
jgi:hypothetical protein